MFASFQGEAGFAGMPTIWIRFFGCNLECNGFGQQNPKNPETYILPYKNLDTSKFKTLEELPVFEYGCDSSYSWSSKFKSLVHTSSAEEVVEKIFTIGKEKFGLSLEYPYEFWYHPLTRQPVQLCFTGGEPMLWQKQMMEIIKQLELKHQEPVQITVETNGTIPLDILNPRTIRNDVFLSVSPKLFSVSGEREAVKVDNIVEYSCKSRGWLKFVVNGTDECWDELDFYVKKLKPKIRTDWDIWVMPVGATKEQQETNTIAQISDEAMRRGYKVATRNHAYVYGNKIGK